MRIYNPYSLAIVAFLICCPAVLSAANTSSPDANMDEYTGVLEDADNKNDKYQLIPNELAVFCKTNAQKVAEDPSEIKRCINKLLLNMKDFNAEVQASGMEEYKKIRLEETQRLVAKAIAKNAVVPDYEQIQDDQSDAADNTTNEHEDNLLTADSINVYSSFVNSIRDLYTERLKSDALYKLEFIELSKVKDIIDTEMAAATSQPATTVSSAPVASQGSGSAASGNSSPSAVVTENTRIIQGKTYTASNPLTGDWMWVSGNTCERQVCTGTGHVMTELDCVAEVEPCKDGIYTTKTGSDRIVCMNGDCIRQQELDDAAAAVSASAATGQNPDVNSQFNNVYNWLKNNGYNVDMGTSPTGALSDVLSTN